MSFTLLLMLAGGFWTGLATAPIAMKIVKHRNPHSVLWNEPFRKKVIIPVFIVLLCLIVLTIIIAILTNP